MVARLYSFPCLVVCFLSFRKVFRTEDILYLIVGFILVLIDNGKQRNGIYGAAFGSVVVYLVWVLVRYGIFSAEQHFGLHEVIERIYLRDIIFIIPDELMERFGIAEHYIEIFVGRSVIQRFGRDQLASEAFVFSCLYQLFVRDNVIRSAELIPQRKQSLSVYD